MIDFAKKTLVQKEILHVLSTVDSMERRALAREVVDNLDMHQCLQSRLEVGVVIRLMVRSTLRSRLHVLDFDGAPHNHVSR